MILLDNFHFKAWNPKRNPRGWRFGSLGWRVFLWSFFSEKSQGTQKLYFVIFWPIGYMSYNSMHFYFIRKVDLGGRKKRCIYTYKTYFFPTELGTESWLEFTS